MKDILALVIGIGGIILIVQLILWDAKSRKERLKEIFGRIRARRIGMILQRCVVAKNETDDGNFKFPQASVGMELWIMPATMAIMRYRKAGTKDIFQAVCVHAKDQNQPVPVEVLEFTNDFSIEGYKE